MRRLARHGVLLLAVVALLAGAVPPARANTRMVTVFSGMLEFDGGLKNPGSTATPCMTGVSTQDCVTVQTGPPGPRVTVNPGNGNTASFRLSSSACVSTRVSDGKGPESTGVEPCTITATGVLWGFNGAATGWGVLSYAEFMGGNGSFTVGVQLTMIGNVLSLVGGGIEDAFRATILVGPDPEPEPKQEDPPPPESQPANGLAARSS